MLRYRRVMKNVFIMLNYMDITHGDSLIMNLFTT